MSVPIIPDYISPIVGYRIWGWDAIERLRSLNGEIWFPGQALAAKCRITGNHECPADGCSCGVYAAKNYEHLQKIAPPYLDSVLHGEVCVSRCSADLCTGNSAGEVAQIYFADSGFQRPYAWRAQGINLPQSR
jgi:hypothetical protein